MKKIIIIALLLIAAIGIKAQTVKIKSKSVLADSIYLIKGGIEVAPIVSNVSGDTTRSISYAIIQIQRDTSQSITAFITAYDKNANIIESYNQVIPGSFFNKWSVLIQKVDNAVLKKRLVKQ